MMKITEEQLQEMLRQGLIQEEDVAPLDVSTSNHKITIGVQAKDSKSLQHTAVDIVKFIMILKQNLDAEFAMDISVGITPALQVPQQVERKSQVIGFEPEKKQESEAQEAAEEHSEEE